MATSIGDLVATLGVNNRPFKAGLSGAQGMLSGFASKVKSTLGSVAGMFGVGLGAAGMAAAGKSAVDAYTVQEQSEKKLAAVITATGGAAGLAKKEMTDYAAELQRVTNFGDETTISAMAVLATFKSIRGEEFKRATALAQDLSAVLKTDLQSSVLMIGKALEEPVRGMTALRRAGVSFNEEEQKKIRLLVESGEHLEAQRMILAGIAGQVEGSAKAMADPMVQLHNRMGDLNELIGKQLKPAIVVMMEALVGGLERANKVGTETHGIFYRLANSLVAIVDGLNNVKISYLAIAMVLANLQARTEDAFVAIWGWTRTSEENAAAVAAAWKDALDAVTAFEEAVAAQTSREALDKLRKSIENAAQSGNGLGVIAENLDDIADAAQDAADALDKLNRFEQDQMDKSVGAYENFAEWMQGIRDKIDIEQGKTTAFDVEIRKQLEADGLNISDETRDVLSALINEYKTVFGGPKTFGMDPDAALPSGVAKAKRTGAITQEPPQALERGSAEAWKKIVGAMYGKDRDRQQDAIVANTGRAAEVLGRMEAHQAEEAEI